MSVVVNWPQLASIAAAAVLVAFIIILGGVLLNRPKQGALLAAGVLIGVGGTVVAWAFVG